MWISDLEYRSGIRVLPGLHILLSVYDPKMDTVRGTVAVRALLDLYAHAYRPVQTQVLVGLPP